MDLQVIGKEKSVVTISDSVIDVTYNQGLVHQVIVAYQAGKRQNTSSQKSRSEVSGGGAKPWKQKGTGRARAGTSRSPLWRSGGVTFATGTANYSQKVNKKMRKKAMSSMLSELYRKERLLVIEKISLAEPKTKALLAELKKIEFNSGLIILEDFDINCALSARNIPHVNVISVSELSPLDLISNEKVMITVSALKLLEENLEK